MPKSDVLYVLLVFSCIVSTILLLTTLFFARIFYGKMQKDEEVLGFESHWGGFGGGLGGWRLSASLVYLLASLAFAVLTVFSVSSTLDLVKDTPTPVPTSTISPSPVPDDATPTPLTPEAPDSPTVTNTPSAMLLRDAPWS